MYINSNYTITNPIVSYNYSGVVFFGYYFASFWSQHLLCLCDRLSWIKSELYRATVIDQDGNLLQTTTSVALHLNDLTILYCHGNIYFFLTLDAGSSLYANT